MLERKTFCIDDFPVEWPPAGGGVLLKRNQRIWNLMGDR